MVIEMMAGITDIYPAVAQSTSAVEVSPGGGDAILPGLLNKHGTGGSRLVILGHTIGHTFSADDTELLQLVVVPQLVAQGVDVESMEVCEADRSCLCFTLCTPEAKSKLLAMHSLAFTDQIIITFADPSGGDGTYPVLITLRADPGFPVWPSDGDSYPNFGAPIQPLVYLQQLAAVIKEQSALRFLPVFERSSVVMAEGLCLRLDCRCPEDANVLLDIAPSTVQWRGMRLSFYEPGLHALVTDEDARAMLCKLTPALGQAAIRLATGVNASVVGAAWAEGQALVTVGGSQDYDLLLGEPRSFAGKKLTFAPRLYPVALAQVQESKDEQGSESQASTPDGVQERQEEGRLEHSNLEAQSGGSVEDGDIETSATLEQVEARLRACLTRLEAGDDSATPLYDKLSAIYRAHPDYVDPRVAALCSQPDENAEALKVTRSFVPPGIWHMTKTELAETSGLPPKLVDRLWNKRALWLLRADKQRWTSGLPVLELCRNMGPRSFDISGLDHVEVRALFLSLPQEAQLGKDVGGCRAEYRERVIARAYADMMCTKGRCSCCGKDRKAPRCKPRCHLYAEATAGGLGPFDHETDISEETEIEAG